jgi:peptidoglycan-associated lipoprotein
MIRRIFFAALAASLLLSLPACSLFQKKKPAMAGVDGDFVNGTPLPDRPEGGVSFTSDSVDRHKFAPVHFAFDSYAVQSSDQGTLEQVASYVKQNSKTVIIAGFTDERGTPEYNRGLGERRSQAVRESLIQLGADAAKLQTVSFGAEMPAAEGHDEAAWAKNRRAEFGITK